MTPGIRARAASEDSHRAWRAQRPATPQPFAKRIAPRCSLIARTELGQNPDFSLMTFVRSGTTLALRSPSHGDGYAAASQILLQVWDQERIFGLRDSLPTEHDAGSEEGS